MDNKLKKELQRKLIHLSSIYMPLSYIFFSKEIMLSILIPVTILVAGLDFLKSRNHFIHKLYIIFFRHFIRASETGKKAKMTGGSFFLIGTTLSILFFDKLIAIESLLVLIIGDTFAAMIGKGFGKTKFFNGKSLEGSMFFVVASFYAVLVLNYFIGSLYFPLVITKLFAIFVAACYELYAKEIKIDDNILIPMSYGIAVTFVLNVTYFIR